MRVPTQPRLNADGTPRLSPEHRCWCGSGRKFKRCHMNRHRQSPLPLSELKEKTEIGATRLCMHADAPAGCGKTIVDAHSLQRRGILSSIARDGEVYGIDMNIIDLLREGDFRDRPIRIRSASTFSGFCNIHDSDTFRAIETAPFTASADQCFLFGYRALCMELYKKKCTLLWIPQVLDYLDRGRSFVEQHRIQRYFSDFAFGVHAGARDLTQQKALYDEVLRRRAFSEYQAYVIEFGEAPELVATGACQPEFDFDGQILANLDYTDRILNFVTYSLIPVGSGGAFVLGWMANDEPTDALVRSFEQLPDSDVPHAVVRFVCEHCENTYFSPQWWEALADSDRKAIARRTAGDPGEREADCLADDGIRAVRWTVKRRARLSSHDGGGSQ